MVGLGLIEERVPGILDSIAAALSRGHSISQDSLCSHLAGLACSRVDALAAIQWLGQAGMTHTLADGMIELASPDVQPFVQEARQVRRVIAAVRDQLTEAGAGRLVVTWPRSLPIPANRDWQTSRRSLTTLLDSATQDISLLSPFVDEAGVAEIGPALERALSRGVRTRLLTRHLDDPHSANSLFAKRLRTASLSRPGLFRAYHLALPGHQRPSREIIHAKVVTVDGGHQGYVGSVNLTGRSLRDVLEVGVLVPVGIARSLATLIDDLLRAFGQAPNASGDDE